MAFSVQPLTSRLIFDKYDSDFSGYIDAAELGAMCREMGRALDALQVTRALAVLDKHGNGRVAYDDFLAWWAAGLELSPIYAADGAPQRLRPLVSPVPVADSSDPSDDLCSQRELNEELLLQLLERRFSAGAIYTDGGPMLLAMNPYRPLPLYGPDVVEAYAGADRKTLPPHVFRMAADGFAELQLERRSQACAHL